MSPTPPHLYLKKKKHKEKNPPPRAPRPLRSYALLPYLYTQFLSANGTGAPVMRPLWYEFPQDSATFDEQHTFMLGGLGGGALWGAGAAAAVAQAICVAAVCVHATALIVQYTAST